MDAVRLGRPVIVALVAMGLLAGCGGAGTTASVPPAMTPGVARHATSSDGDLLYVVMNRETYMLSWPELKVIHKLNGFAGEFPASNPNNGDVLLNGGESEWKHGASKPFAKLRLSSGENTQGGAFNPTNNDIALIMYTGYQSRTYWVAVYSNLYSTPVTYSVPNMQDYSHLGFDSAGDLFIDGTSNDYEPIIAELPAGSSDFIDLNVNHPIRRAEDIQWDGTYITVRAGDKLYRLAVSGSMATLVGTTTLRKAYGLAPVSWTP